MKTVTFRMIYKMMNKRLKHNLYKKEITYKMEQTPATINKRNTMR